MLYHRPKHKNRNAAHERSCYEAYPCQCCLLHRNHLVQERVRITNHFPAVMPDLPCEVLPIEKSHDNFSSITTYWHCNSLMPPRPLNWALNHLFGALYPSNLPMKCINHHCYMIWKFRNHSNNSTSTWILNPCNYNWAKSVWCMYGLYVPNCISKWLNTLYFVSCICSTIEFRILNQKIMRKKSYEYITS